MNEILAVLLLALYPFYLKDTFTQDKEIVKEKILLYQKDWDISSLANELYFFLYQEKELQADLYTLFNAVMQRGILELYKTTIDDPSKKENFASVF